MTTGNTSELLDQYLAETPNRREWDESPDLAKWKKLKKPQIIKLIAATLERYSYLREHDDEIPDAHLERLKQKRVIGSSSMLRRPMRVRVVRCASPLMRSKTRV